MIARFKKKKLLANALTNQKIVAHNEEIATLMAAKSKVVEFKKGQKIITEGGSDNHMYMIIDGVVEIYVNGKAVAKRTSGDHIGEMAMLDSTSPRSADVVANEKTYCAKIKEKHFKEIANSHPVLWQKIAFELAERLRQRKQHLPKSNEKPKIFIGSSAESLDVVREMRSGFYHDDFEVTSWNQGGVFGVSRYPVEDLLDQVKSADFAILVLGADDKVISRKQDFEAPRDNVIFELGLFIGHLGRDRVFIASPKGVDIKIPSDLIGLSCVNYKISKDKESIDVLKGVHDMRKKIKKIGVK